jgi:WD40 repeat protein
LYDGYRFVAAFFVGIDNSPGQVYTSGLSFAPKCALVDVYAKERESNRLVSPRDALWESCLHVLSGRYDVKPAFSSDGRLLALSDCYKAEIRDVTTLYSQKTLQCDGGIALVDFHPINCSLLSVLGYYDTVKEWNLSADPHSGREIFKANRRNDLWPVKMAYNPNGTRIIFCVGDFGTISVWSTNDCSKPLIEKEMPRAKTTFSLDSAGNHIDALFVSKDKPTVVKRWSIESGVEVNSLQIPADRIDCAVFAKNNTMLITGHYFNIRVWILDGDSCRLSTAINSGWYRSWAIDATRSGDVIASGGGDHVIRLWDTSSGVPLAVYYGHAQSIRSLVFSPQEDHLVSLASNGVVRVWDTSKEALSLNSSRERRLLDNVIFSPNGEYIAASAGSDILLWDGTNGSSIVTFAGHQSVVHSLAFSPDSNLLASISSKDGLYLWDLEKKESPPRALSNSYIVSTHEFLRIVFSATGKQLAAVFTLVDRQSETSSRRSSKVSLRVKIWDVSKYEGGDSAEAEIGTFQSRRDTYDAYFPHLIRFSPQEPYAIFRYFHSGHESGKITIWDCMNNTMKVQVYNEKIHPVLNRIFDIKSDWITETKARQRLLWLPENRRPFYNGEYLSFAIHRNLVAIVSDTGVFSLLDMSPFINL